MFFGHLPAGYLCTTWLLKKREVAPRDRNILLFLGLFGSVAPDLDMFYFYGIVYITPQSNWRSKRNLLLHRLFFVCRFRFFLWLRCLYMARRCAHDLADYCIEWDRFFRVF